MREQLRRGFVNSRAHLEFLPALVRSIFPPHPHPHTPTPPNPPHPHHPLQGYCIKTHRAAVLPSLVASLGTYLMGWLFRRETIDLPMRAAALCLADDLLEHASPDVRPH
jgi:hypothetical protein